VLALDMIGLLSVSFIAVVAIASHQAVLLDAAIALALVSFLGTVAFARFIERKDDA
jgi:multicomponent Na+:H+ antiporter subunit F